MPKKLTTEEFIRRAKAVHGDKYDYSKVEYANNCTKVCIICPIHGEFFQIPKSHLQGQGCAKCGINHNRKGAFNIGIVDCSICEKRILKKSYIAWRAMMTRCYSYAYKSKYPTYTGCSVCEEWKRFSEFEKWYNKNHIENTHLDKDIIYEDNKIYSPKTCCFVPNEINALFKVSFIYYRGVNKEIMRGKTYYCVYDWINGKRKRTKRVKDFKLAVELNYTNKINHTERVCEECFKKGKINEGTFVKIKERINRMRSKMEDSVKHIIDEHDIHEWK